MRAPKHVMAFQVGCANVCAAAGVETAQGIVADVGLGLLHVLLTEARAAGVVMLAALGEPHERAILKADGAPSCEWYHT